MFICLEGHHKYYYNGKQEMNIPHWLINVGTRQLLKTEDVVFSEVAWTLGNKP